MQVGHTAPYTFRRSASWLVVRLLAGRSPQPVTRFTGGQWGGVQTDPPTSQAGFWRGRPGGRWGFEGQGPPTPERTARALAGHNARRSPVSRADEWFSVDETVPGGGTVSDGFGVKAAVETK